MEIIIIVAMASNRVIGANNDIPWHIPEELKQFKEKTVGSSVIMGRKTYESIGFPLPDRKNIILTRNSSYTQPNCITAHNIREALALCTYEKKVFILGGAEVFQKTLTLADTIYLTVLDRTVEGDTYFPDFSHSDFKEVEREEYSKSEPYTVITYKRVV